MNQNVKKYLFPSLITLAAAFLYYYLALPAINIRSGGFWGALVFLAVTFIVSFLAIGNPAVFKKLLSESTVSGNKNKKKKMNENDYVVDGSLQMPKWLRIFFIVFVC